MTQPLFGLFYQVFGQLHIDSVKYNLPLSVIPSEQNSPSLKRVVNSSSSSYSLIRRLPLGATTGTCFVNMPRTNHYTSKLPVGHSSRLDNYHRYDDDDEGGIVGASFWQTSHSQLYSRCVIMRSCANDMNVCLATISSHRLFSIHIIIPTPQTAALTIDDWYLFV